jgi:O-antigen/teichoic acid export membrane protein
LVWLAVGSLFVGTLVNTCNSLLNTLGFRGSYVLLANVSSWLGLGLALTFAMRGGRQAEFWMSGGLVAQLVVLVFSGALLSKVGLSTAETVAQEPRVAQFDLRQVFSFSWPLIITTSLYWIQTNGYRVALVHFASIDTVGLLTTGLALAMTPMAMLDTLFTEYYRPIFYRNISFSTASQKALSWSRYASAYFPVILLTGLFVGLTGPFLARVLVSTAFQSISWLALWGAAIQSALMVYATYVSLSFASLDTRVLIRPNIIGAGTALLLTFVLGRRQPLLGTALALTMGMIVTTLDTAWRLGRDFPHPLPWKRLALAGLMGLPLVIAVLALRHVWPAPTQQEAVIALGGAGVYVIAAQLLLAQEWLRRGSEGDHALASLHAEVGI